VTIFQSLNRDRSTRSEASLILNKTCALKGESSPLAVIDRFGGLDLPPFSLARTGEL
jgi:hypothetical protein